MPFLFKKGDLIILTKDGLFLLPLNFINVKNAPEIFVMFYFYKFCKINILYLRIVSSYYDYF